MILNPGNTKRHIVPFSALLFYFAEFLTDHPVYDKSGNSRVNHCRRKTQIIKVKTNVKRTCFKVPIVTNWKAERRSKSHISQNHSDKSNQIMFQKIKYVPIEILVPLFSHFSPPLFSFPILPTLIFLFA